MIKNRFTLILLLLLAASITAQAEDLLLDRIVAIVDESVITDRELAGRVDLVKIEIRSDERNLPPDDVLRRQVLEQLISDSLLTQEAQRRGIKVTDSQLNQAMQRLARQNRLSLSDFRRMLIDDGINYAGYRETVRREMAISTLARQYGLRNANVSDTEVDEFIARNVDRDSSFEYKLSHILIAVPEAADPDRVKEARQFARDLMARLDDGESFESLANTYSAGDNALRGGDLGWRKKAEIPTLFTQPVLAMKVGEYAGPIRSPSGFHVVHLEQLRDLEQVITEQIRSRHILLKPNELVSEEDARQRLLEFRQRLLDGEDFGRLARLYSVDFASGANGGDIGWQDPGATADEYEEAIRGLQAGELSQPFRSEFGWHLVEVTGKREIDETEQNRRNKIYRQLLTQKQREVFDLWKRRLRDEAYVVLIDASDDEA